MNSDLLVHASGSFGWISLIHPSITAVQWLVGWDPRRAITSHCFMKRMTVRRRSSHNSCTIRSTLVIPRWVTKWRSLFKLRIVPKLVHCFINLTWVQFTRTFLSGILGHIFTKYDSFEVRKRNDNDRHVVKSASHQRILYDVLDSKSALLVDVSSTTISHTIPHTSNWLLVR